MRRFFSKYTLELLCILLAVLLLAGCSSQGEAEEPGGDIMWQQITAEEAMDIMNSEESYVILDVRRPDEYSDGHIPGAVNLANETIGAAKEGNAELEAVETALPDKDQLILVYCRSGNRSKQASQKLAELGYARVLEFGGIQNWPGEIEH